MVECGGATVDDGEVHIKEREYFIGGDGNEKN